MEINKMNNKNYGKVKVAAVQAEQEFLLLDSSVEKCISLIKNAADQGCELIVFPESYIPGYPDWYAFIEHRDKQGPLLGKQLFLNSLSLEDEGMKRLQSACGSNGINAVLGINETEPDTRGTMYNTHVYITKDGEIAGKHQKYVPNSVERLTQAPGNTGYHNHFQTDFGTVSSLICGENANPLGIYAATASYSSIHAASWPAHFAPPSDMQDVIRMCTRTVAFILKAFVINSVSRISNNYIEIFAKLDDKYRQYLLAEQNKKGGATIIDPSGKIIACGDADDSEILVAELDLNEVIWPRIFKDYAGHYNRPELFAPLFKKYM